jgi:uncharacterized membrane protein required for colicin V production
MAGRRVHPAGVGVRDRRRAAGIEVAMLNGLDFFIVVAFMAIIGFGFFNGITKVTAAIFAIYFGTICSAAFYRPLTDLARSLFPSMSRITGELTAFFLLFLALSILFTVLLSRWLGDVRLPRRVAIVDNIGGAALGVVVSGLALTLAALALAVILQALNQTVVVAGHDPILNTLRSQIQDSTLVPIFLRMAPFFLRGLDPWFPCGLPPILNSVT